MPVESQEKKQAGYSHVLLLADGTRVNHAVDDLNPHAPLPTDVNGIPVISVSHATVGGPA